MTLTQILKTLVTCILVIAFILVTASAYRQHRTISALARLSDATSAIVTRLAIDELTYVDNFGNRYSYVIDPGKLENIAFIREVGGDNFEFRISVHYMREDGEYIFGPYGIAPPEGKTNCSLTVACTIWSNDRLLPAKLGVIAWYA